MEEHSDFVEQRCQQLLIECREMGLNTGQAAALGIAFAVGLLGRAHEKDADEMITKTAEVGADLMAWAHGTKADPSQNPRHSGE